MFYFTVHARIERLTGFDGLTQHYQTLLFLAVGLFQIRHQPYADFRQSAHDLGWQRRDRFGEVFFQLLFVEGHREVKVRKAGAERNHFRAETLSELLYCEAGKFGLGRHRDYFQFYQMRFRGHSISNDAAWIARLRH